MTYPLISEYVEAVRNAEDNFDKLRDLRPVTDDNGNPVMTSGNFAVVFKMRDEKNDKLYAVKCFLKDQPNRAENYRMIAEELEFVSSSFLTKFQYLDNELFVDAAHADGEEYPVLLMDWVEGTNLDQYIRQHLHDSYQLHLLAYQFSRLALWLMPQPFAHGDLKPDNIMVREDGTLVLIDYDGMFVPAMKGQKAREMGITIPIIPGIKPLAKLSQLTVVPKTFHCDLPQELAAEVKRCKTDDDAKQLGIEWATHQCQELYAHGINNIHFYTVSAVDSVAEVTRRLI